jgi:HupE / UreJ protein
MKRSLVPFLLFIFFAGGAFAHEVRPAYLELRQTSADTYDVLWKVPGRGEDLRFGVYVRLPANCQKIGEVRTTVVNNAFSDRWTVQCKGGLTGRTTLIEGLTSTAIDVLIRLQRLDGTTQVTRLTPDAPSFVVESAPSRVHAAATYVSLGAEHILYGIDHLLFVLGLMLLARDFRSLVKTITAFCQARNKSRPGMPNGSHSIRIATARQFYEVTTYGEASRRETVHRFQAPSISQRRHTEMQQAIRLNSHGTDIGDRRVILTAAVCSRFF